jgi:ADP-ribosylglycohydrolase
MSYNTKRDGYYSRPAPDALGKPVGKLEPRDGTTHVITIPGTTYRCFINIAKTDDLKLLKALARTTVNNGGRRRVKASPRLFTIDEYNSLHTEVKAA